jgi:secreted PhoX family phosphatase
MKSSRRRFLKLVAAGSAAVIASNVVPVGAATASKPATTKSGSRTSSRSAGVEAEIKKQKGFLTAALKAIRDYDLPPGSEQAFVFAPIKAAPRHARSSGASAKGGSK